MKRAQCSFLGLCHWSLGGPNPLCTSSAMKSISCLADTTRLNKLWEDHNSTPETESWRNWSNHEKDEGPSRSQKSRMPCLRARSVVLKAFGFPRSQIRTEFMAWIRCNLCADNVGSWECEGYRLSIEDFTDHGQWSGSMVPPSKKLASRQRWTN